MRVMCLKPSLWNSFACPACVSPGRRSAKSRDQAHQEVLAWVAFDVIYKQMTCGFAESSNACVLLYRGFVMNTKDNIFCVLYSQVAMSVGPPRVMLWTVDEKWLTSLFHPTQQAQVEREREREREGERVMRNALRGKNQLQPVYFTDLAASLTI